MQVIGSNTEIDIEHHFKVHAGPGAGKTSFLVNHINNVIHRSTRFGTARKIACITYTNVGVDTLLNRINDQRDYIEISTIHSFLFSNVVKPYIHVIAEKYDIDPKKVDSPMEHTFSNGYFQNTDLPRKYVTPDEIKRKLFWKTDNKSCKLYIKDRNKDYHKSLVKYKSGFWEKGIIHYDDILAFAWEIINTNSNTLRIIRAKYPYFFIDEFQDTSPIQAEIIKLISLKETVIGVIGDKAQSIYSFQGASMQRFIDFKVAGMKEYRIENNHRSTKEIIDVLNIIRTDLTQKSPTNKPGNKPKLLIGNSINGLEILEKEFGKDKIVTLSYMVPTANAIRSRTNSENPSTKNIDELLEDDSNSVRRRMIISVIKAIEFTRQSQYSDAIKELAFQFRRKDDYKGQKLALLLIKFLLSSYQEFSNEKVWKLYQILKSKEYIDISKINENKENPSKVESLYKNLNYKELALSIRMIKDESMHRTIHKAKGDEFSNVMVIVKGKYGQAYNEERDLSFLLTPNLIEDEAQRVYYVACSRAKNNLIVNVPSMSDKTKHSLSRYFDIIEI